MRTYIIKLAVLFMTITLLSCSDNPAVRYRYNLEKEFYKVEKETQKISIKPSATNSDALKSIKSSFISLVTNCYTALNDIDEKTNPVEFREIEQITFNSVTRLSQFLFTEKKYDSCSILFNQLMNEVRLPKVELMTVYYNLGRAQQAAGNWDSALTVYDNAAISFYPPVDREGNVVYQIFNLPRHVLDITTVVNDLTAIPIRQVFAEDYYNRLINDFPDSKLSISAHANLARIYELSGDYVSAIEQISMLKDSSGKINTTAKMRIADIRGSKLNEYSKALSIYEDLENSIIEADTIYIPTIKYKIALIYLNQGKYEQCRKKISEIEKNHWRFYSAIPSTQLTKAQAFEREGKWSRAETEYRYLIDNYHGSAESMSTYLYLSKYYTDQGRTKEAETWLKKAEEHFDQIATQYASTLTEAAALSYKAELYRQKNDWQSAVSVLERIFDRFESEEVGRRAIVTAANIYNQKLNDKSKADSLINELKSSLHTVDSKTGL